MRATQKRKPLTPDERKAERLEYMRSYMRAYRKSHPEKTARWRITTARHLLQKVGYTVTDPEGGEAA